MRNKLLVAGLAAAGLAGLLTGTATLAHHAFAAEFDGNKPDDRNLSRQHQRSILAATNHDRLRHRFAPCRSQDASLWAVDPAR